MVESLSFQTRARALDHLGREQIADVPTAISELWKNSYDAYADKVNLTLYADPEPVVAICDNGHGMNKLEFLEKWLVVGTESKLFGDATSKEDRLGLPVRPKQGQKGIGRLSSAQLGPIMLLVSKRKNDDFVVALLDWRLFENPYLILSDIKVPVATVKSKAELFPIVPELFETLMGNIWGNTSDKERDARIANGWKTYDEAERITYIEACKKEKIELSENWKAPSEIIAETIIGSSFNETHLSSWQAWNNEASSGTALLVATVNNDFLSYLRTDSVDTTDDYIKERFRQTLTSFVDPFCDRLLDVADEPDDRPVKSHEVNGAMPNFQYTFDIVEGGLRRSVIGDKRLIDRQLASEAEHVLFGTFDESGTFKGCVKVFNEWRKTEYDYVVPKPKGLKIPTRSDTRLGRFDIFLSTFEIEVNSSKLTPTHHSQLTKLANEAAAFLVFRDGLRVLPYGREESDFFEIETRRSLNAGRYFWNKRRIFGRLALRRSENPNLKDKAGREGFIDNTSAKVLKQLVINVLIQSSDDFFGRKSDTRKNELSGIKEENKERRAKEKAEKDAEALEKRVKAQFTKHLNASNKQLPILLENISIWLETSNVTGKAELSKAQKNLEDFRNQLRRNSWTSALPKSLTRVLEASHKEYEDTFERIEAAIALVETRLAKAADNLSEEDPVEILGEQVARAVNRLGQQMSDWDRKSNELLLGERRRLDELRSERMSLAKQKMQTLLKLVGDKRESLSVASKKTDIYLSEALEENSQIFDNYIRSLENLQESIDLENIALHGIHETNELRAEVVRLNELAQLGIAVEILGHELQSYDTMIASGMQQLPKELEGTPAVTSIEAGYEGLTRQLRFLSPLQVSGRRAIHKISGKDIYKYVDDFFGDILERRKINLTASDSFRKMKVYDQPSRLFPVFINLVNNSQYWLATDDRKDRKIHLDVVGEQVAVSDNGPGIDSIDIKRLFKLFFTRKSRDGRGIGLYLCRANLRASGHDISYADDTKNMPLDGANFLISFNNVEFE